MDGLDLRNHRYVAVGAVETVGFPGVNGRNRTHGYGASNYTDNFRGSKVGVVEMFQVGTMWVLNQK